MNALAAVVFTVVIAVAHAGYYGGALVGPPTKGVVLQAPSAKASIKGPDGSYISAAAPGGAVVAAPKPGGVVSAAFAPGYASYGYGYESPAFYGPAAVIAGPAAPYAAYPAYGPGSGYEGQYIPDYTEKLYDDGSYKGEFYGGYGAYKYY